MDRKAFIFFLILFVFSNSVWGQNRKYYDNLKKNKKSSIAYSKEMLKTLQADKKHRLDKLLLIQEQIRKRKEILYIINKEITLLEEEIQLDEKRVTNLNSSLKGQKDEYAKLIYFASLNMNLQRRMIYILSAKDFNSAYKRIVYLKQLTDFRKNRSQEIITSIRTVDSTLANLKELKLIKESLQTEKSSELDSLNLVKRKLNKYLGNSQSQIAEIESEIQRDVVKKKEIKKTVTKQIDKQEEAKEKKVADEPDIKKDEPVIKKSHKLEGNITKKFRGKKRWHLWPLKKCVVLHHYGDYYHPKLKHVIVKNDGIELGAKGGNNVHAIFEGKVISVIEIAGDGFSVIIQHGDFYSVYSKVENIIVKEGDVVNRGQIIAKLAKGGNMTKLIFQLWYKKTKLNPELWLKKR